MSHHEASSYCINLPRNKKIENGYPGVWISFRLENHQRETAMQLRLYYVNI